MKRTLSLFLVALLLGGVCLGAVGCAEAGTVVALKRDMVEQMRYKAHPAEETDRVVASFTDGDYNYFYYYLGSVEKCPIVYETAAYYDGKTEQTLSYSITKASEEQIEKSISDTVSESTSHGGKVSLGVKFEFGKLLKTTVSAGLEYNNNFTETNSTTSTVSSAAGWTESHTSTTSYTIGKDCEQGYYRYTLFATCDVYVVIVYDLNADRGRDSVYWDHLVCARENTYHYGIDFSEDAAFSSDGNAEKLRFDERVLDTLDLDARLDFGQGIDLRVNMLTFTMDRKNCNDGNEYDVNEQEEDAGWRSCHDAFELGHLELYGCTSEGQQVKVVDPHNFRLYYRVDQDVYDLPREGAKKTKIESDSTTRVKGTHIIDEKIGMGAYEVRIAYTDGSGSEPIHATDIFYGTVKNDYINLLPEGAVDPLKTVDRIEVTVAYEVYSGGPGFIGIWWNEYTNWYCTYTFDFTV